MNEAELIWLGLSGWFRKDAEADGRETFSLHRESGWGGILAAVLLMLGFESVAVHVFLRDWSPWVVRLHALLAVYTAIWLLGDYQAIRKSGLRLTPGGLEVRLGQRWYFRVPRQEIACVLPGEPKEMEEELELKPGEFMSARKLPGYAALTVNGKPSVHLVLNRPIKVAGWFGQRKTLNRIGLGVDDAAAFIARVGIPRSGFQPTQTNNPGD